MSNFYIVISAGPNLLIDVSLKDVKAIILLGIAHPILIDWAVRFLTIYPRQQLPDWVEILANGSPNNLIAVVDVAKADIHASEGEE